MLRYSLRTLGAAVAAIAIGCAALLNANHWVASTAWTLVFLVLSLATIAAVLTRRGFWTGFAIAGWLYLLVGIGPVSGYHKGNLLTTTALHWSADALHPPQMMNHSVVSAIALDYAFIEAGTINPLPLTKVRLNQQPQKDAFVHVGQTLWTVLVALLGGWFGAFIVARHRPAQMESSG